jgi:hypothetical protein
LDFPEIPADEAKITSMAFIEEEIQDGIFG